MSRVRILLTCLLASAVLAVVVPVGAVAVSPPKPEPTPAPAPKIPPPPDDLKVLTFTSLTMAPSVVPYHGIASVSACMKDGTDHLIPNKRVVFQSAVDGSSWTTVTTLFSTTGNYATSVSVVQRTCFRILFRGDAEYVTSVSPTRVVTSKAYLTAPGAPATVYKGAAFNLVGYLKPRHKAGQSWVTLQFDVYSAGAWKRVKSIPTATSDNYSYSKYTASTSLPYLGKWRIRAFHSCAGHVATYTGYTYVTAVVDPTIRLKGTGPLTTGLIKLKAGSHKVDYTFANPADSRAVFGVRGWRTVYPDGVHPGSLEFVIVPFVYFPDLGGSGSGTSAIGFSTDVAINVQVVADPGATWTLAIH